MQMYNRFQTSDLMPPHQGFKVADILNRLKHLTSLFVLSSVIMDTSVALAARA
jgi:hypothetical protein